MQFGLGADLKSDDNIVFHFFVFNKDMENFVIITILYIPNKCFNLTKTQTAFHK